MVKVLTFRLSRLPTVPGAPGLAVGNKLSTPLRSSIAICLKRTDLEGNNANDSVRPYVFGNKLMEAVNAAMLNAGCENGFCINYTPLRIMTPRASSCLIAAVFCSSVMEDGQITA